jgi:hypothetical protein
MVLLRTLHVQDTNKQEQKSISHKKLQKPKKEKEKEKSFNPWKPIVAKAKAVVPERKREIRSRARERMQLRS